MDTHDSDRKNREDIPRDINFDELGFQHPAKKLKSEEKIKIKESGMGRDLSQTPYEEHLETNFSQLDKETIQLQEEKRENPQDDFKKEINENDNRDQNDSTKDWDAENSRTGRHK